MQYKKMSIEFIVPSDVESYHLAGMLEVVLGETKNWPGGWQCSETLVRDSQLIDDNTIIMTGEESK